MRSYRVNGWNEDLDNRTGEFYYSCPDCGCREDSEHDELCSRYTVLDGSYSSDDDEEA